MPDINTKVTPGTKGTVRGEVSHRNQSSTTVVPTPVDFEDSQVPLQGAFTLR